MQHGNCCEKPITEWPSTWHETRCKRFQERVSLFGLIADEHIKTVAHAVENLGAEDQDIIDYLTQIKATQEEMILIAKRYSSKTEWSLAILNLLKIDKGGSIVLGLLKLTILIIISPFVLFLNLPAKISFRIKMNKLEKNLHHNFLSFMASRKNLI